MNKNLKRSNRKLEHLKHAFDINSKQNSISTGLDDIVLMHQALPKYNIQDIDTSIEFLGKKINSPIYINAMTGGHSKTKEINEYLGKLAAKLNIPIAVGSQKSGIEDNDLVDTYKIVRDVNPDGIVIGNLSANASVSEAKEAVEMINANALQLHLNVAQEIVMKEGDTNFSGIRNNIVQIANSINVPVIVKEVGCGMSKNTISQLINMGINYIDISGAGGTNFIEIEYLRNNSYYDDSLMNWGIPTAYSMIEAKLANCNNFLVSGGIKNALDIAKCLSMGANLVGLSGEILKNYNNSIDLLEWIRDIEKNLAKIMLLTNSKDLISFKNCDKVIKGQLLEWKIIRSNENVF